MEALSRIKVLDSTRNDPARWVREFLGESPEPWQEEAWNALRDGHKRVSIRSGHGVGKTYFVARTAMWFLSTRGGAVVPIAANTQDQLRDTIWPELRKCRTAFGDLAELCEIKADRVIFQGGNFGSARTVNEGSPEGLQGFHAENLLFVIDEASGIPDIAFEIARGALSTPGAIQILTGNPTRNDGFFYRTHHQLRADWFTMRVNSEDVARARGHIDDIIADYGENSNQYRVRVLGEFPKEGDDTLIPLSMVEDAIDRDVSPWDRSFVWGVDVARFGDDRSALAKRWGNVQPEPVIWWHGNDTMETVGRIVREYNQTPDGRKPARINVDVIGVGAGVVDRLREMRLPVTGVNVGERPLRADQGKHMRRGDELWWDCYEWFKTREVVIPRDDLLISELTSRRYTMESSGKLRMEPKDMMKKRGLKSPDVADAFVLTFAGGDYATQSARAPMAEMDYDVYGYEAPRRGGRRSSVAILE